MSKTVRHSLPHETYDPATDNAVSARDLAKETGIPAGWWYNSARRGHLPPELTFRCGKYRRFWIRGVKGWLARGGGE